ALDRLLPVRVRRRLPWLATLLGILYLVAAHFDAELMRWMGQHLTLSWMGTYLGTGMDPGFIARILGGAAVAFFAGFAITVCISLLLIVWARRGNLRGRPSLVAIAVALAVAGTGLSSKWWFGPSSMR